MLTVDELASSAPQLTTFLMAGLRQKYRLHYLRDLQDRISGTKYFFCEISFRYNKYHLKTRIPSQSTKMSTQQIRDQKGHLLGTISSSPNNQQNARDSHGRFLGSYDPHTNVTRDASGRAIGTGNSLASLIR